MKSSRFSKEINSESESFELQVHQMKKFGFQINKKKITQGGWSQMENKIYLDFLIQNHGDFKSELMRRKTRVFYRISKLLKKRTADQCRSHHQKLLMKHKGSIEDMIKELRQKTSDKFGQRQIQKGGQKLKNTSPCTVELANENQMNDESSKRQIIDYADYFTAELTAQFLQLNISLDQIRMW